VIGTADGKNANKRKGLSSTEARESDPAHPCVAPATPAAPCVTSNQQGRSLGASAWFRLLADGTRTRRPESHRLPRNDSRMLRISQKALIFAMTDRNR